MTYLETTSEMHYKIFVLSLNYYMCGAGCTETHTETSGLIEPIQATEIIYDTLHAQHE